jgi:hypothetical protein
MNSNEYYNQPAAAWARQNIRGRVEVRPFLSSRAGMIFTYSLIFCVPAAFFALAVVAFALGVRDPYIVKGPLFIGLLMLIPCGTIALLSAYVRRGFAKYFDAEGVSGSFAQRFPWGKLYYVDHVTKHIRAGRVSHRIKDNQLELVFEGGKVIIPPLIHDRAEIWEMINRMPADVRDDGVPRAGRAESAQAEAMEYLLGLLKSPDASRQHSDKKSTAEIRGNEPRSGGKGSPG